jgi:hypothetical protein
VDCLLLSLYRNEKRRLINTVYSPSIGGASWSFSSCRLQKFALRNGEPNSLYHRLVVDFEDFVVV